MFGNNDVIVIMVFNQNVHIMVMFRNDCTIGFRKIRVYGDVNVVAVTEMLISEKVKDVN